MRIPRIIKPQDPWNPPPSGTPPPGVIVYRPDYKVVTPGGEVSNARSNRSEWPIRGGSLFRSFRMNSIDPDELDNLLTSLGEV